MPVEAGEMTTALEKISTDVCATLRASASFSKSVFRDGMIVAEAAEAPEPVEYRLFFEDGALWVSWSTPDRWLSQSIEADLMFTGDDLDDMIDEEIVDLGWELGKLGGIEHFRSEDKRYTFRSKIGLAPEQVEKAGTRLAWAIMAYDIVFAELGDMKGDEDDD